eukprot:scaffold111791_cov25-Prasinocladus_malaysianus.AAC.4
MAALVADRYIPAFADIHCRSCSAASTNVFVSRLCMQRKGFSYVSPHQANGSSASRSQFQTCQAII